VRHDAEKFIFSLIGLLQLNCLVSGLLIELGFLDRDAHLVANGLKEIDFLRLEFTRRPARELKNP
jgi:hypothetical protein